MQVIALAKAIPGMKVARPVTDNAGNLLLREGFELTTVWIERLRERGIMAITVEAAHADALEEDTSVRRSRVDAEVDEMFVDVMDNEVMRYLAQLAKTHLKARVASRAQ
ncbi:MAG: hypothetical protein HYZ53_26715 [Planctomycetes bacterium]|nr:hypothetical protein [Planctomycetota bacterium]